MLGHGCPHVAGLTRLVGSVFLTGVLLLGHDRPSCPAAEDLAATPVVESSASDSTASDSTVASASPFNVRYPGADGPLSLAGLSLAGQSEPLTVDVVGMAGHADQELILVYEVLRVDDRAVVRSERSTLTLDQDGNCRPLTLLQTVPEREGVYEIRCSLFTPSDKLWSKITRDNDKLASARFPWLIYQRQGEAEADEGAGETATPGATENARSAGWKEFVTVTPVNADQWPASNWIPPIPESASRLVPDVRRVTKSWTGSASDAEHASTLQLGSGESIVAKLPDQTAHQPYRLTIRYGAPTVNRQQQDALIEFSDAPDFRVITRTLPLAGEVAVDLSTARFAWGSEEHLLCFSSGRSEYIRITNRATEQPLSIESIRLAHPDAKEPASAAQPSQRRAYFQVRSSDWSAQLTSDYEASLQASDFAAPTIELFRLWKATTRIPIVADWFGFDTLVVPVTGPDPSGVVEHGGLIESRSSAGATRYDKDNGLKLRAMLRWLDGRGVRLVADVDAIAPPASLTESPGTRPDSDAWPASQLPARLQAIQQLGTVASCWDGVAIDLRDDFSTRDRQQPPTRDDIRSLLESISGPLVVIADDAVADQIARVVAEDADSIGFVPRILRRSGSGPTPPTSRENASSVPAELEIRPPNDNTILALVSSAESSAAAPAGTMPESSSTVAAQFAQLHHLMLGENPRAVWIESESIAPPVSSQHHASWLSFLRTRPDQVRRLPPSDAASAFLAVIEPIAISRGTSSSLDHSSVTFINHAPWSADVKVRFASGGPFRCEIDPELQPVCRIREGVSDDLRLLTLHPNSIVNVRLQSTVGSVRIASWQASMVGGTGTLETLKSQIGEVVKKIGTLAQPADYPELRNGGFELDGQMGIVGWMHTQFPESAVVVDRQEAIEGQHSIRMTTDQRSSGRTWLVSEPIPVPSSGRLAVSLALRAAIKPAGTDGPESSDRAGWSVSEINVPGSGQAVAPSKPTHRVRVSLEGTLRGAPVRFLSELDVPCDGSWQPRHLVLETDQLLPEEMDTVRLTIDSLSSGRLWVDDVHLHDQFPIKSERVALQGKAFLAIQGLQRGQLEPAARLIENHWAQHLLDHSGETWPTTRPGSRAVVSDTLLAPLPAGSAGRTDAARSDVAASDTAADPEAPVGNVDQAPPMSSRQPWDMRGSRNGDRPSVAERIRQWLPRPLRF
ncbi:hypothetical protein FYK55_22405 [Roseiconus nitratireducens]|uniref:Uncharacterized protein n=1 Tax=Roseiconus nitratireducens TaxID=2605748 RepID=A0A5M6CXY0_9BACT|nr:hypothetical protein [Roseiconus nitratireducens]KAA5540064.1 hypothetical protein FYK55_22405 [Roseiconus nitratireducens]